MVRHRCAAQSPVAILSFHSHGDRSFLDDRELALLSGALRDDGIANDLVVAVVTGDMQSSAESDVEQRLAAALFGYDPIVYERVWSAALVERLRRQLARQGFIGLRGEHVLLESAPADIFCDGAAKDILPALVQWLRGGRPEPPARTLVRRRRG